MTSGLRMPAFGSGERQRAHFRCSRRQPLPLRAKTLLFRGECVDLQERFFEPNPARPRLLPTPLVTPTRLNEAVVTL